MLGPYWGRGRQQGAAQLDTISANRPRNVKLGNIPRAWGLATEWKTTTRQRNIFVWRDFLSPSLLVYSDYSPLYWVPVVRVMEWMEAGVMLWNRPLTGMWQPTLFPLLQAAASVPLMETNHPPELTPVIAEPENNTCIVSVLI